jgi:hypothetical protein
MAESTSTIPVGFCQCGCGQRTAIAHKNYPERGWVKGQPLKFLPNHRQLLERINLDDVHWTVEDRGYKTPCWIWQRNVLKGTGYGHVHKKPAHLALYEHRVGPVPEGLELDHLCRVRACVNPEHLEPVTHTENMRRASWTKLTIEKAREVRDLIAAGYVSRVVAEMSGVHRSTVNQIRRGSQWREVG